MTLVIGQPSPLASQVCTLYLFNFLRFFSTRHFKGIDHIHLYATHKRVHMFNYLSNLTTPTTSQPGPLASQVPKCVPLQLSRSGDAQVAPQCNDQSCKNWRRNWGSQIPKYGQIFWKLSKSNVSCLLYGYISANLRCRVGKNRTLKKNSNNFLTIFNLQLYK